MSRMKLLLAALTGVLSLAATATAAAPPLPSPTPTPALRAGLLSPTPLDCGYGTFGAGNWPDSCWRPYGDASPFNRVVPRSPRVVASSSAIVSRLLSFGPAMNMTTGVADSQDYGHPTYYSSPLDPLFTLACTMPWGTCAIEGQRIRIPDRALPAGGGDGHMTVVDQIGGWEYDFWQVAQKPRGGGVLKMSWGGRTRIDGDGRGSDATAARYGNLAGIIRAQELEAGHIDHALFMSAHCDSATWVYPALKTGRSCSSAGQSNVNAPPMGSHFQLAYSAAEIDALAVPPWKKTVLHALREYGAFVGDTTGGSWGFSLESGRTYTSFGYEDAMVRFARENNLPRWNGHYVFAVRGDIDWSRLRVLDPCVSQGTC